MHYDDDLRSYFFYLQYDVFYPFFLLFSSMRGFENRTYASKYIPIIASVSEHQPPTWPSYFMDINVLAFLVPAGIIVSSQIFIDLELDFLLLSELTLLFLQLFLLQYSILLVLQACFLPLSDASSFAVLYIVTSVYFSGVMVYILDTRLHHIFPCFPATAPS